MLSDCFRLQGDHIQAAFRPKSGLCLVEKLHFYSHATFGLSADLISSPKGKAEKFIHPFTPDGA